MPFLSLALLQSVGFVFFLLFGSCKVRAQPLTQYATTLVEHMYPCADAAGQAEDSLVDETVAALKVKSEEVSMRDASTTEPSDQAEPVMVENPGKEAHGDTQSAEPSAQAMTEAVMAEDPGKEANGDTQSAELSAQAVAEVVMAEDPGKEAIVEDHCGGSETAESAQERPGPGYRCSFPVTSLLFLLWFPI